jgi:hypothetical protein
MEVDRHIDRITYHPDYPLSNMEELHSCASRISLTRTMVVGMVMDERMESKE